MHNCISLTIRKKNRISSRIVSDRRSIRVLRFDNKFNDIISKRWLEFWISAGMAFYVVGRSIDWTVGNFSYI